MDAQFIIAEDRAEIITQDERVFKSKENENSDDFYVRVASKIDEDLEEPLTIKREINEQKLRKMDSTKLKNALKKAGDLETEMIEAVLAGRSSTPEEKIKASKKAVQQEKRAKKEKPTPEGIEKAKENNKQHIGKTIMFTPSGLDEVISGTIKGFMVDKRVNLVYFRIQDEAKTTYHKRVDATDITIKE